MIAKSLQKWVLNLHSMSYTLSGYLAITLNDGMHPKHRIMKYKEWFVDNIEKGCTVLDVGCNTGTMPEVMSQKAGYVYGIEIVEKHIQEAIEKHQQPNIEFICDDATTYDYSNCKAIDLVTLSNVLEHIEDRVRFLEKLSIQIKWKDKKRFLIRVPMIDREWIAIYKKELGLEYRLDRTHFIEYTYDSFVRELEESNVNIISSHIRFGEIYAICEVKE